MIETEVCRYVLIGDKWHRQYYGKSDSKKNEPASKFEVGLLRLLAKETK